MTQYCNLFGGCGANSICTELNNTNSRLCTCVAGYETASGLTSSLLYGTLSSGQGKFGGGSSNAGDGCTQGLKFYSII